jgi:hypothetical protein
MKRSVEGILKESKRMKGRQANDVSHFVGMFA